MSVCVCVCVCVCVRARARAHVPVGVGVPVGRGNPSVLGTELCVQWGVEVLRPKVADHSG